MSEVSFKEAHPSFTETPAEERRIRLIDVLIELVLEFLGLSGIREIKRKGSKLASPKSNASTPKQDTFKEGLQVDLSVCAGCNRRLKQVSVYEFGKSWCTECYKSQVLKIRG